MGLVMTGVAGGVKRVEMVMVGEDARAGVTAGWLLVVEEEVVEAMDTGLQFVPEKILTGGIKLDTVLGWKGLGTEV